MGQYYNSVLKDEIGTIANYYNFGLKLMEHSYFFNKYVNSVCKKLVNSPHYVAWVGDYAEEEDYQDRENADTLREMVNYRQNYEGTKLLSQSAPWNYMGHLLVNHSKKQFIDLDDYYRNSVLHYGKERKEEYVIHPLPLLTAVGNGKGGGDYYGDKAINKEDVGLWAGDLIEIVKYNEEYKWNYETKQYEYKGYKNITDDVLFDEGY
jgi:hypothetical protein